MYSTNNYKSTDIAIIGISCRFPKANNIVDFFHNIETGKNCFSKFNKESFDDLTCFEKSSYGEYIPVSAVIDEPEYFDADFFNILPTEALTIDPQHRVLLECSWEALEAAGYIKKCKDIPVGVYTSCGKNTYLISNILGNSQIKENIGLYQMMLGNYNDFLSSRISYKLGLTGPAISIQSACSSSLVALHYACQDIILNNCEMAIVGTSMIRFPQNVGYLYEESGIFSQSGECHPFSADANGIVPGNGVASLIIKKLKNALNDNDTIYGVIKGSSVNNDGNDKIGYTAPSISGQKNVIISCLEHSGVKPEQIKFIETHGTGTRIGDPIECEALKQAYCTEKNTCALTSIKSQIGHLDASAGLAGVIKAVLCLQNRIIPPTPYFKEINPYINLSHSLFYIPKEKEKIITTNDEPAFAGVSSFGLGGTNAHVILMEAPNNQNISTMNRSNTSILLPFSAKNEDALKELISCYIHFIEKNPDVDLENIAHTLWHARIHFKESRSYIIYHLLEGKVQSYREKKEIISYRKEISLFLDIEMGKKIIDNIDLSKLPSQFIEILTKYQNIIGDIGQSDYIFILTIYDYFYNMGVNINMILPDNYDENSFANEKFKSLFLDKVSKSKLKSSDSNSCIITNRKEHSYTNCFTVIDLLNGGLLDLVGNIWSLNYSINFQNIYNSPNNRVLPLPTYPFQRKKFYIEKDSIKEDNSKDISLEGGYIRTITKMWQQMIGLTDISEQEDFFDIGGDSLIAVRFLSQINSIYKVKIEMNEFMQNSTIIGISNLIQIKVDTHLPKEPSLLFNINPIVKLKEGGSQYPIILLHPAGGTVFCYHELLNIKNDNTIYGIQYPIDFINEPVKKVPELAKEYFEMIIREIKADKYILIGYSLGGNIAFEIATIMQERGLNVDKLVLLDSHPPKAYKEEILDTSSILESFPFVLNSFLKIVIKPEIKIRSISEYYETLKHENSILNEISFEQFNLLYNIWKNNHLCLRGYEHVLKYKGQVFLLEAQEMESDEILKKMRINYISKREWEYYVNGKLEIISIPGNHYTILSKPNSLDVCKHIEAILQ